MKNDNSATRFFNYADFFNGYEAFLTALKGEMYYNKLILNKGQP